MAFRWLEEAIDFENSIGLQDVAMVTAGKSVPAPVKQSISFCMVDLFRRTVTVMAQELPLYLDNPMETLHL